MNRIEDSLTTELITSNGQIARLTTDQVVEQIKAIHELLQTVMKKGEHYGTIPGCGDKLVLLKPGAEKIASTFRLAPRYKFERIQLANGHLMYDFTARLRHIESNAFIGEGVGCCSTMESKYRYRGHETTPTGELVPKAYWDLKKARKWEDARNLIGGDGFTVKKIDDAWVICKQGERQENPDIADTYNTVKKIAKKRSLIEAVLTATAASDIFVQDLGDGDDEHETDVSNGGDANAFEVMKGRVLKGDAREWNKVIRELQSSKFTAEQKREVEALVSEQREAAR